jgi:hypothetical protein
LLDCTGWAFVCFRVYCVHCEAVICHRVLDRLNNGTRSFLFCHIGCLGSCRSFLSYCLLQLACCCLVSILRLSFVAIAVRYRVP